MNDVFHPTFFVVFLGNFSHFGSNSLFCEAMRASACSVCKSCTTFPGSRLILCRGLGPWTVHVPVDNFDSLPQLVRVSLHLRRKWMQIHGQMTLFSIFWSMRPSKILQICRPCCAFFCHQGFFSTLQRKCSFHLQSPSINICAINPFDNIVHKLSSTASVHTSLCPDCVFS